MRARSSCAAPGSSARTAASARTDPVHTAGASRLRDAGATTSPQRSTVAPWISAAGRGAHVPRTSRAPQDPSRSDSQRPAPTDSGRGRRRVDGFSISPLPLVVDHVYAFELRADRRQVFVRWTNSIVGDRPRRSESSTGRFSTGNSPGRPARGRAALRPSHPRDRGDPARTRSESHAAWQPTGRPAHVADPSGLSRRAARALGATSSSACGLLVPKPGRATSERRA